MIWSVFSTPKCILCLQLKNWYALCGARKILTSFTLNPNKMLDMTCWKRFCNTRGTVFKLPLYLSDLYKSVRGFGADSCFES